MIISISFSSICWAGTTAAIGSLIFINLSDMYDKAKRTEHSLAALCVATFLGGFSLALLLLTTIAYLRQI